MFRKLDINKLNNKYVKWKDDSNVELLKQIIKKKEENPVLKFLKDIIVFGDDFAVADDGVYWHKQSFTVMNKIPSWITYQYFYTSKVNNFYKIFDQGEFNPEIKNGVFLKEIMSEGEIFASEGLLQNIDKKIVVILNPYVNTVNSVPEYSYIPFSSTTQTTDFEGIKVHRQILGNFSLEVFDYSDQNQNNNRVIMPISRRLQLTGQGNSLYLYFGNFEKSGGISYTQLINLTGKSSDEIYQIFKNIKKINFNYLESYFLYYSSYFKVFLVFESLYDGKKYAVVGKVLDSNYYYRCYFLELDDITDITQQDYYRYFYIKTSKTSTSFYQRLYKQKQDDGNYVYDYRPIEGEIIEKIKTKPEKLVQITKDILQDIEENVIYSPFSSSSEGKHLSFFGLHNKVIVKNQKLVLAYDQNEVSYYPFQIVLERDLLNKNEVDLLSIKIRLNSRYCRNFIDLPFFIQIYNGEQYLKNKIQNGNLYLDANYNNSLVIIDKEDKKFIQKKDSFYSFEYFQIYDLKSRLRYRKNNPSYYVDSENLRFTSYNATYSSIDMNLVQIQINDGINISFNLEGEKYLFFRFYSSATSENFQNSILCYSNKGLKKTGDNSKYYSISYNYELNYAREYIFSKYNSETNTSIVSKPYGNYTDYYNINGEVISIRYNLLNVFPQNTNSIHNMDVLFKNNGRYYLQQAFISGYTYHGQTFSFKPKYLGMREYNNLLDEVEYMYNTEGDIVDIEEKTGVKIVNHYSPDEVIHSGVILEDDEGTLYQFPVNNKLKFMYYFSYAYPIWRLRKPQIFSKKMEFSLEDFIKDYNLEKFIIPKDYKYNSTCCYGYTEYEYVIYNNLNLLLEGDADVKIPLQRPKVFLGQIDLEDKFNPEISLYLDLNTIQLYFNSLGIQTLVTDSTVSVDSTNITINLGEDINIDLNELYDEYNEYIVNYSLRKKLEGKTLLLYTDYMPNKQFYLPSPKELYRKTLYLYDVSDKNIIYKFSVHTQDDQKKIPELVRNVIGLDEVIIEFDNTSFADDILNYNLQVIIRDENNISYTFYYKEREFDLENKKLIFKKAKIIRMPTEETTKRKFYGNIEDSIPIEIEPEPGE